MYIKCYANASGIWYSASACAVTAKLEQIFLHAIIHKLYISMTILLYIATSMNYLFAVLNFNSATIEHCRTIAYIFKVAICQ